MRIYLRLLVAFLLLSAGNVVYAEAQQEKRVTGTVTSEGEPLPGVSVQVKGLLRHHYRYRWKLFN